MSRKECPCENSLSILGLKTKPTKKEVKKNWKKLQKYHPDHCPLTFDDEFNQKCREKYNDLTALINSARDDYEDLHVTPQREINDCINCYKQQLKKVSEEEIRFSLYDNELDVHGSRNTLESRLLDNVPYKVFELNIWQYNAQIDLVYMYLKHANENKLMHILKVKDIPESGNKNDLIKTINENIDETELLKIIQNTEKNFKNYRTQLKKLSKKQLVMILRKNNLSTKGEESVLIDRILDNLDAFTISNSLENTSKMKEDALNKLEKLIGRTKFSQNYMDLLNLWGLNKHHGIRIKEEITLAIYDYEISEKEVENTLNNLLEITSKKHKEELLDKLYSLTGKSEHSRNYLQQLNVLQLSEAEGEEVKNELINLIKAHKIQKSEIETKLLELLEEKYRKFEEEKLKILYDFSGEESHSPEFKKLLDENGINENDGFNLKKEMEILIKSKNIANQDIVPKFKEFIKFKGYDIYLSNLNIYELNQLAIINNVEITDNNKKQKELIIHSNTTIYSIKSNIDEIKSIKNNLKSLSKKQLQYILNNFKLKTEGIKKDLIYRLLSKIHYENIKKELSEITSIENKLNDLTIIQLDNILTKHSISYEGNKSQKINELTKRLTVLEIKNDLNYFMDLNSQLNNMGMSGINYICDMHNINNSRDQNNIIQYILNNVDLMKLKSDMLKVNSIEKTLKTLNRKQLEYLTQTTNVNTNDLLNTIDLKEVENINKVIKRLTKKLNSYNINQLNYILKKNQLPPSNDDKKDQIDTILQHVSIPDIQENIRNIKQINNKLNSLSDKEVKEILEKNGMEFNKNKDNKSQIKDSIPIEKIEKYLSD